jgi:CheY-like chemotaxis protein
MVKKPILIVEDDESIGTALQLSLEMFGYTTERAANGAEGLEKLATMPRPGVVLLDLMMPVMDGWAFVEAIERRPELADLPIVVLTAFSEQARAMKQARKVLPKPVDLDVLVETIRPYCG